MPDHFVSYLRVSTHRQGVSGLGIEAQRDAIARYIAQANGELLAEHVEVESGKVITRPILAQALVACRKHKATLLVAKFDRLGRNVAFVSSLMESGVEFVAADFPAANRLLLHILAAVAEHEREQIGQRTKAALAAAKARGIKLGVHGAKLAAANRARADQFAETLREPLIRSAGEGNVTLRAHADFLNRSGYRSTEEALFSPTSVRRIKHRLEASDSLLTR